MNLRTRARKLFSRDSLSEHTVRATKIDHAVLRDLRKRATVVDDAISTPPRLKDDDALDGKIWERLAEDIWSEFYSADEPSLRARDQIDQRFRLNRELADKTARDEGFRETRSMTRGHVEESALGWLNTLDSLAGSIGDELAEHAERENEIADAQDTIDSIDDQLEELRQQRRNELEGDAGEIDQQIRDLAQRKRIAINDLRDTEAEQAKHAGDLIDAARAAVAQAAEGAREAVECASLLPGREPGSGRRTSPDLAIEFANRVHGSPVLKKVLEMMGALQLSMGSTRRQMRHGGYEELVDIGLGNDLRSVLPAEKVLLTHPVAKLDFYRRFHERSLTVYEYESEMDLKKGPVIFGADGSSSMQGPKNIFCRGLTLAACEIANREGRNSAALEFAAAGQLREFWFPGKQPLDTEMALEFASHFYAGGTNIRQVLVRAKELIDNEAPFHSADLVIVTDGGDVLDDETLRIRDALREMNVRIHGLMIAAQPTQYLVEVCDKVTPVWEFVGPNETSKRLAIDLT